MATSRAGFAGGTAFIPAFGQGFAILEVGPDRRKYYIHKAVLSQHSEYFRKALNGPWKEAEEGVVTLLDVEPETVNIFSYWLYTQKLPETDAQWNQIFEHDFVGHAWQKNRAKLLPLLKAYVFGDRFLAVYFRQAVNRAFVLGVADCWVGHSVYRAIYHFAFKHIPSNRIILQSLVDDFCEDGEDMIENDEADNAHRNHPPDFLARAVRELWDRQRRLQQLKAPEKMERCYDEHVTEKEKADCNKLHMVFLEEANYGFFE